jgi:hypothetical protein
MKVRIIGSLVLMTIAMSGLCCMEDSEGPGRVRVDWQVDGATCSKAGIVDIRVELLQLGESIYQESARCTDGTALFENVAADVYDIRVRGYDTENNPFYEATYQGLAVKEGSTPTEPPEALKLKARKGALLLDWVYPKDQSDPCSFGVVDQIEVNVAQSGSVVDIFAGVFPCAPALGDPADLPAPLNDGKIEIADIPPGEIDIVLFGLSPDGERVYYGEEKVMMANSGEVQVTVSLEPCEKNCI